MFNRAPTAPRTPLVLIHPESRYQVFGVTVTVVVQAASAPSSDAMETQLAFVRPGESTRRWTVFNSNGSVVAMLQGPERFDPLQIGIDFVLGRWTDELGEEHIHVYRLTKG